MSRGLSINQLSLDNLSSHSDCPPAPTSRPTSARPTASRYKTWHNFTREEIKSQMKYKPSDDKPSDDALVKNAKKKAYNYLRVNTDLDLTEKSEWIAPPPPSSTRQIY